ncbi:peptide chain release factor N(5)-glutamine methyltransferase [Thalassotalea litorea]|uniref:Release factor glutamine methyltransferase n=2 Tax=Thalassotalea litorea TaxID=2020715 RepID=A0A5R9IWI1_9GAMM|nr:peptide chain release factor N(5)-glutamine methyltransferase [Thalassotalea litorea]
MSIAKALTQGQQQLLDNRVVDSPKLDCQLMLAHVLNVDTSYLHAWPEKCLTQTQYDEFLHLLSRREQGEPIAFLLGEQEFWSLPFKVSPCTLIPRPDTEVLVETVLQDYSQNDNVRLLDLGTGTGAIALAIAHEKAQWQVEAVDYSHDAVALARSNAEHLHLQRVKIYQSNWFSNVSEQLKFDVIVSNPPYIDVDDPHLSQGDVRFEPNSALVAEDHGFKDIRHIISLSRQYLMPGATLYIEHGFEQHTQVQKIYADYGFEEIETICDYGGQPRMTKGKWAQSS